MCSLAAERNFAWAYLSRSAPEPLLSVLARFVAPADPSRPAARRGGLQRDCAERSAAGCDARVQHT